MKNGLTNKDNPIEAVILRSKQSLVVCRGNTLWKYKNARERKFDMFIVFVFTLFFAVISMNYAWTLADNNKKMDESFAKRKLDLEEENRNIKFTWSCLSIVYVLFIISYLFIL